MLHHYYVSQFAAEILIIALGEHIRADNLFGRPLEEHGIAVRIDPCRPANGIELLFEVGGTLHQFFRLPGPSFSTYLMDEPPELQGLHGIARTIYHAHIAVQVGHIEVGLVVVHVAGTQEQA